MLFHSTNIARGAGIYLSHTDNCCEIGNFHNREENLKHEEDDHQTGIGRGKRSNGDSSGKTGRNGGEGEVLTCDDSRQQLDRRKPEWKGDSRTKFVRR